MAARWLAARGSGKAAPHAHLPVALGETMADPASSPAVSPVEFAAEAASMAKPVEAAAAPAPAAAASTATGAPLLKADAVRLACEFYDTQGPFVGQYTIATPVLGAYFNGCNTEGSSASCEWSVRYHVAPSTGEEVRLKAFKAPQRGLSSPARS